MLLGILLAFLVNLSPMTLDKAVSQYSSNKFLMTDNIYRKIGSKNAKNNTTQPAKKIVIHGATTTGTTTSKETAVSPEEISSQSGRENASETFKPELNSSEKEAPMHMNQKSENKKSQDEKINNNSEFMNLGVGAVVNHEHLKGQLLVCDSIYERQCGGSHCVQIFEGVTKCVVDLCQGTDLIACINGLGCYSQDQHCDNIADCEDSSDELGCLSLVTVHDERHFYTRTVPFMAILCLMGVAASFVLYHQTNAARQRQRHLSMVGLTNALTSAGIARDVDRPLGHRSSRISDGPETDLLNDFGDYPLEAVGFTTQRLEHLGAELQEFDPSLPPPPHSSSNNNNSIHLYRQYRSSSPDSHSWCERALGNRTFQGRSRDYFGYCGYLDSRRDSLGEPPPYETALEMGTIKESSQSHYESVPPCDTSTSGDPPPYESVSHITCTSVVPVTDV